VDEGVSVPLTFVKRTRIHATAAKVFAFHERLDALQLLSPPWQNVTILQPPKSLAVGTRVVLRAAVGPFRQTIVAEHVAYEAGKSFTDRMVSGPFAFWQHHHIVQPDGDDAAFLEDRVEYVLPLGVLGRMFGAAIARRELTRLFDFRHEVTRRECESAANVADLTQRDA